MTLQMTAEIIKFARHTIFAATALLSVKTKTCFVSVILLHLFDFLLVVWYGLFIPDLSAQLISWNVV